MVPTLVVNTAMVSGAGNVRFHNSGEASRGVRFGLQLANGSMIPSFAISIGKLLDNLVGVKVVDANLLAYQSGRTLKMWGHTDLFAFVPGDASQWGGTTWADCQLIIGPYTK